MIRVARIEPFSNVVEIVDLDENSLTDLQRVVAGGSLVDDVESITLHGAIMLVGEHGKLRNDPMNWFATSLVAHVIGPDYIVGNAVLIGPPRRGELTSVTDSWLRRIERAGGVIKQ